MQEDNTTQVSPYIPLTAPEADLKGNKYTNHLFVNIDKTSSLGDACLLFLIIAKGLKRPYNNTRARFNPWHDSDFVLEATISNVDFASIKASYDRRTYTKHFNALIDKRAIKKVNANVRCHKYYVNPDYAHVLERYAKKQDSQCDIYYEHYSAMWLLP